jgi:hypothetical protein
MTGMCSTQVACVHARQDLGDRRHQLSRFVGDTHLIAWLWSIDCAAVEVWRELKHPARHPSNALVPPGAECPSPRISRRSLKPPRCTGRRLTALIITWTHSKQGTAANPRRIDMMALRTTTGNSLPRSAGR